MYTLSEHQITFILDDLKRKGIETEDLQSNLLDHVCCIIEAELEENGDFESFYSSVIRTFYKTDLKELEEETQSLLTFKNYYAMKKAMMVSGVSAAVIFTAGLFLKFGHMPGAAFLITIGIGVLSLVFLPLLAVLKIRERRNAREKMLLLTGVVSGIALSLGTLFKIMFWPGANMLGMTSVLVLLFGYLPLYFFTGIRDPEKKTNTIVSSILILAGCGLFLTLVRTPAASQKTYLQNTRSYVYQEALLEREKILAMNSLGDASSTLEPNAKNIYELCETMKAFIIRVETGNDKLQDDYETTGNYLGDTRIDRFIQDDKEAAERLQELKDATLDYNQMIGTKIKSAGGPTPISSVILESKEYRTTEALNSLVQIQLSVLQNQRLMTSI